MKGCIWIFVISAFVYLPSSPVLACENFQAKVERYTALKRKGGSAKQMNRWSAQKRDYTERYQECRRAQPKVHRASGAKKSPKKIKADYQSRRSLTTDSPVNQRLLNTCNFWIDSYNRNPDSDNKSYRDTACRALDDALKESPDPGVHVSFERSLADCIKPKNLVDDEVKECMRGEREALWQ